MCNANYKDIPAIAIESEKIRALFLPEHGGKLASLIRRDTGKEYLAQTPGGHYKPLCYAGCYTDAECSGFDDMFPTIDPCCYEEFPWAGVNLPDHGEVCGLPWEAKQIKHAWELTVHGVRLPYRMTKQIAFEDAYTLRIAYMLKNLSMFDMDFVWAAHIMLNAEEGGKISAPFPDQSPLACIFSQDGAYADRWNWPVARLPGREKALNHTSVYAQDNDSFKFYFLDPVPAGSFSYRYPSDGSAFSVEVSEKTVPYFAVWENNGSFHQQHTIAFEPCTGAFDRPDLAKLHHMNSVLKANGEYRWFIKLHLEMFPGKEEVYS